MSHKRKLPVCPNCSYIFNNRENFCPSCGQENHELKIPLGHLIYEGVESVFHFDTKFFKTIGLLLFKPGILSKEFNDGKRARFVPPFRLYIFISFIFFFLFSIFSSPKEGALFLDSEEQKMKEGNSIGSNTRKSSIFNLTYQELDQVKDMSDQQIDSVLLKNKEEASMINRFFVKKGSKLAKMTKAEAFHKILKNTSILMFILMPFFALLLMGFYFRKKKYYFELLIFSIHFHSFLFLFLTLFIIVDHFFNISPLTISLSIFFIYLVIAMRNFFAQSWLKTFLKTFLVLSVYSFFLIVFMLLTLASVFY